MAAVFRLALGVLLCFPDSVISNIIEIGMSKAAKKGEIVAKCGCSDLECSFIRAVDSQRFEISKSGNIVLAKDAVNFEQETLPISVKLEHSCYTNMAKEQKFIMHIIDSSNSVSMSKPLLHCSMLNGDPALVGTIDSLTPPGGENDQYTTFYLLGPMSEHFKVEINSANEVQIVKEPSFMTDEAFTTFLFILVFKSESLTYYYNTELFMGFDIEDSEDRYISVQESHAVKKRQISTVVPRNVIKNISVYENSTGVLFNILDNPSQNHGMSFEILESLPEDIFQISEDDNVTLKDGARLDYDKGSRIYTIRIEAKANSGAQVTRYLVRLEVLDSNDEFPVFVNEPRPFLSTLRRDTPIGTTVYTLNASDPDPGSSLRFYNNGSVDFTVDETIGSIITARDFNDVNDTDGTDYVITVFVSDIAAPVLQTTETMVTVRMGPRGPQFYSTSYTANVRDDNEVNQVFPLLDDQGSHSPVRTLNFQAVLGGSTSYSVYSSVSTISDKFGVSVDGNLRVLAKLLLGVDAPQYHLIIQAQDSNSGLTTKVNLTVNLLKNYKPMFTLPVYTQTVLESLKINDSVLTVETIGNNSTQNFNYSVDSSVFWVESLNGKGIIRVKSQLDYEAASDAFYQDHSYTFHVTVDGYNITSLVVVYIQNVNDEAPTFTSSSESTIQDTIAAGRTVMNVKAIDKDGDKVTYSFNGYSSTFNIDQTSGKITIAIPGSQLPDDQDYYLLTVIAQDDGSCCEHGTIHTTTQNIRINIVDSKNFKPQFVDCRSYYNASILEEEPRGTVVLTVSATDRNKGENGVVDYTILSFRDDLTQDFTIEKVNNTGVIKSNVKFDRETLKDILKVTVIATDHGQPPLSSECSFIVDVIDINDNAPAFLSGENVQGCDRRDEGKVSRDSSVSDVALNIRAFDIDSGENAEVVYSLVDNPGNYFDIITKTGMIFVNRNLSDAPERVSLQILASDKGEIPQNSTTFVDIVISNSSVTKIWPGDKNNPDQVIDDNTRTDALINTVSFGTMITGARLIVKCQSSENTDKFKISVPASDNTKFELHAAGDFDDEKDTKVVQIRVYTGQGNDQKYEDSFFLFQINDTNNKAPKFVNRENPNIGKIEFSVQEEQAVGEEVGILLAHDGDINPLFNKVTYRTRFNDTNFKVDESSGVISTLIRFDRENLMSDKVDLSVIAEDGYPSSIPGQTGPNTGSKDVQITIEDINDNPPYFSNSSFFFTVPENAPVYHHVGAIKALDKDDEKTSRYTKYSVGDSRFFGVNENTGDIFVSGILFGQANKNLIVVFTADDGKFSASVNVSIEVEKTYNRRPEFSGNYDIKSIVVNRNYNESLFQVKANDPDCANPCHLTYDIIWGDPVIPRVFRIDHSTGEVFLLAPVEPRQYVFSVKVTDGTTSSRKKRSLAAKDAYTTVTINPAACNAHQDANAAGTCECIDYCKNAALCYNGGTCQLNCTAESDRGYSCQCPQGYGNWDCSGVVVVTSLPVTNNDDDNTWLIVLLVCLAVLLVVVILVVAFLVMRRKRLDKDKSMFAYDNDDYDIREDVMDYDEDGAGEDDYAGYDITIIRKPVNAREGHIVPKSRTTSDKPNTSSGPSTGHLGDFINDRLGDAEGESGAPPYDTLHEFEYEGEGSLAGSLSSINTSSSGGSQDYEYLNQWGPKFAKLADMYNTYEDSD